MSNASEQSPENIIHHMLENDAFSKWLGVTLVEVKEGACTLQCKLRSDMLNGYKITHGGVIFSLADSAIAFASASFGRVSVGIDHSISFIKKAVSGDILTVAARTVSMGFKTGVIHVEVRNNENELIAVVKGTVYRTGEAFDV